MTHNGFTFSEVLVAIAIVAVITAIGIPSLNRSKADSNDVQARASAKIINDAITRATLAGDTNPVLFGSDEVAATTYLINNGYIL